MWECLRETEKPNLSGYSAKRRLSIVDLPVPLGPEMMIGGSCCSSVDAGGESDRMSVWV